MSFVYLLTGFALGFGVALMWATYWSRKDHREWMRLTDELFRIVEQAERDKGQI